MATWKEAVAAVEALGRDRGEVTYLHCVSSYPAEREQMNVRAMGYYAGLGGRYGLSDHTTSTTAAVMAVALGATVIEKHVRTADVLTGPDAGFALDPQQLRRYVAAIREAEHSHSSHIRQTATS
jgi:sialic acid synthase SpsE